MATTTRDKIIELAQEAIASRGYSAFSFRELAAELGIKSASIHYHFPTKTHLGVEVARAYRLRLEGALTQIAEHYLDPHKALDAMIALFRQEAATSQRMTVCTMLAAEIKNLPEEIQREMKTFYALNIGWIEAQLECLDMAKTPEKARQIFALLQGGLIGAKSQNDPGYFDMATAAIAQLLKE
ncbi:TetR family transcriptional regulator [Cellvibrio zantedeschiae]|uniref:TetR family transcriptional regulator n=1 Tax=Cellvibrio zantedeschiae TaxID=1237077 RepID=A0ABQ3BBK6_9GAMM|nr:TetR/AcrR family transcriptional regulator [Cellvibrio zantedeschiae]GGY88524.1 TetR family transcriptional regulator [Cellvibrio zantedeschiae]